MVAGISSAAETVYNADALKKTEWRNDIFFVSKESIKNFIINFLLYYPYITILSAIL